MDCIQRAWDNVYLQTEIVELYLAKYCNKNLNHNGVATFSWRKVVDSAHKCNLVIVLKSKLQVQKNTKKLALWK